MKVIVHRMLQIGTKILAMNVTAVTVCIAQHCIYPRSASDVIMLQLLCVFASPADASPVCSDRHI